MGGFQRGFPRDAGGLGFPDPAPNQYKELEVVYTHNGMTRRSESGPPSEWNCPDRPRVRTNSDIGVSIARPARQRLTAIAIQRRPGRAIRRVTRPAAWPYAALEAGSSRPAGLADERAPGLGQLPPQLADPPQHYAECFAAAVVRFPMARNCRQLALAAGQRLQPIAEVDPHPHDLGRSGPPVLDASCLPKHLPPHQYRSSRSTRKPFRWRA